MAAGGNRSQEGPGERAPAAPSVPALVVAGRVALLVLAAGGAIAGFALSRRDARLASAAAHRYACPMHPKVTADASGECPICGMSLTEVRAGPSPPAWRESGQVRQPGASDLVRRRVFSQEVRAPASLRPDGIVEALLYADEIAALEPAERGIFLSLEAPGTRVPVRLASAAPAPLDRSTSWVAFSIEREDARVRAGAAGWLELAARQRAALVVPSSAVQQSPQGAYVLAASPGGTFAPTPVIVGKTIFGLSTIVSGLQEQQRVATRNAFFLDAEVRLAASSEAAPVKR